MSSIKLELISGLILSHVWLPYLHKSNSAYFLWLCNANDDNNNVDLVKDHYYKDPFKDDIYI